MNKVGLAFICGNETKQIEEMLDSVECVKFDSISATITRNSPETEKILKKRKVKISKVPVWKEDYSNWDFAKARQLSYDNCEADWIIYLDTDDVLQGAEKLRELVEKCKDYDAIMLPYDYEPNNIYSKERIIKKGKYYWRGLVHECQVPKSETKWITSNEVIVKHNIISNDRFERNLRIIEREYSSAKTPRTVFYCAKDSMFLGRNEKAICYTKEFLEMDDCREQKHNACMMVVRMMIDRADYDGALEWCGKAITFAPEYCEPYYKAALAKLKKGLSVDCLMLLAEGNKKRQEPPFGTPYNKMEFTMLPKEIYLQALTMATPIELKSVAYDLINSIEFSRIRLQEINNEIARRS